MGFARENQVRIRLPAGGKWIRTLGPSRLILGEGGLERRRPISRGDQQFESPSLQPGVPTLCDSTEGRNRLELRQIVGYREARRFARNEYVSERSHALIVVKRCQCNAVFCNRRWPIRR